MARRRVEQVMVRRLAGVESQNAPDEVIVEEPLEIRLDGDVVATTMRTPGHDFELAAGFCSAEGMLDGTTVRAIRYCGTDGSAANTEFNIVTVHTASGRGASRAPRLTRTTSSCGLCGSTAIAELTSRLSPLEPAVISVSVVERALEEARRGQDLFARTGSVHGAAAFRLADGEIAVLREDIGRHNAADKVIGRLLLDGRLPAPDHGLALSGRVSLEMVHKAWAAGMAVLVSVGGPSSLAIDTARAANITLVAFARPGRMNVYTGDVS